MTHKNMFTPTPELMQEWLTKWKDKRATVPYDEFFATQAAQWGADQELEACCEWLRCEVRTFSAAAHLEAQRRSDNLRTARRKPPSLKEQALAALDDAVVRGDCITVSEASPIIRRALESLPD